MGRQNSGKETISTKTQEEGQQKRQRAKSWAQVQVAEVGRVERPGFQGGSGKEEELKKSPATPLTKGLTPNTISKGTAKLTPPLARAQDSEPSPHTAVHNWLLRN